MYTFFLTVPLAAALLLGYAGSANFALAETCASQCGQSELRFKPGQRIKIEVINRTTGLILFQKVLGTDPIPLQPSQELQFERSDSTNPNLSVFFWDETGVGVQARVSKPKPDTLRIEIRPGGRVNDQSVYIQNDGRVTVF